MQQETFFDRPIIGNNNVVGNFESVHLQSQVLSKSVDVVLSNRLRIVLHTILSVEHLFLRLESIFPAASMRSCPQV